MDIALFKLLFPEFALVSDDIILVHYVEAQLLYKSSCNKESILMNITAHLLSLAGYGNQNDNGIPGGITSATIGSVSITLDKPTTSRNEYQFFLSTTPYGQKALALMKICNAVGPYIGGSGESFSMHRQRF